MKQDMEEMRFVTMEKKRMKTKNEHKEKTTKNERNKEMKQHQEDEQFIATLMGCKWALLKHSNLLYRMNFWTIKP